MFRNWRNLIKGFYDKKKDSQKFLVAGSARLDHYRRGGDSLLGRYRYLRLHPFSVSELKLKADADLDSLLKFGGFPEPLFSNNERDWRLWSKERLYRIVRDDIRDLEIVRDLSKIELLAENWVSILESVYFCFRILPFGAPKLIAVKKEKKHYLWDWCTIKSPGPKFENLVASHLLKYCHFLEDTQGYEMELRFLRDIERREIDFVVLKDNKPLFAVECKTGERSLSPHLEYFKTRTDIPYFYQVHMGKKHFDPSTGVQVLPFVKFCEVLGLV